MTATCTQMVADGRMPPVARRICVRPQGWGRLPNPQT
jgi:hypothetical protein